MREPVDGPGSAGAIEAAARMRAHLAAFAHPRRSGSEGAALALDWLDDRLRDLDLLPVREPFTFDDSPLRIGLPGALVVAAAAFVASGFQFGSARVACLAAAWCVAGIVVVALRVLPAWLRREGPARSANVLACAGSERPRVILMAHWDSKSQWVSFRARTALAVVGVTAALVWTFVALALSPAPLVARAASLVVGALVVAAALARNGNASPGALDNASGVVVVLEVLRRVRTRLSAGGVGVVFTGAEEEGLVGATRFFASASAAPNAIVLNLDTVGGSGPVIVTRHDRRGATKRLIARVSAAAERTGCRLVHRIVPFPAAVDSVAASRTGRTAVTLASGTASSTFRYLHRPSDTLARVDESALVRVTNLVEVLLDDVIGAHAT